jgi:hypothetical protein
MSEHPSPAVPRQVRIFRRSKRRQARLSQALTGLHDGLWLGSFSHETLHRLDASYYDGKSHYVDEAYNSSGLLEWERRLVDAHFSPGSRIVVTGAGGGREVLALRDLGFDALGFEPHPGLAAAGAAFLAARGHREGLRAMPRDQFPADAPQCDGILVGWGSYMLIAGRARRVAFLRAARERLPAGGPLLLSFFVRQGSATYFRWAARTANAVRRARRAELVDEGDALVPNYAHHFVEPALREELARGGFELLEYHAEPYGHAAARALQGDGEIS